MKISRSDWFNQRGGLAAQGKHQSLATPLAFNLSDSPNGTPLYQTVHNFAPRVALAYSPQSSSGLLGKLLGGPGKSSIRAGFGMYYDLFGQSLIRLADATALGFSTQLRNPGTQTSTSAPRYISLTELPANLLPAAPKGGFPQVAPNVYATASGLDRDLQAPYSMNMNFSLGRDLQAGFHLDV